MSNNGKKTKSIFNTESEDMKKSLEKHDNYIRISTPKTWIFTLALTLLTASFIFWGFFGRIPINLNVKGVGISDIDLSTVTSTQMVKVDELICLVDARDNTSKSLENKDAHVTFRDGLQATGKSYLFDTSLLMEDEIIDILKRYEVNYDWVLSQLGTGNYRYLIRIHLDEPIEYLYWGETCDVSITVDEVLPITLLF